MKTPEQIAKAELKRIGLDSVDDIDDWDHLERIVTLVIEADRAQQPNTLVELADHVEAMKKYLKENELPDMTRRAFVADLYDVLREVGEDV